MFLKKEIRPYMVVASTVMAIVTVPWKRQRDTTDISYANQTGECHSFGSISPVCVKIWYF